MVEFNGTFSTSWFIYLFIFPHVVDLLLGLVQTPAVVDVTSCLTTRTLCYTKKFMSQSGPCAQDLWLCTKQAYLLWHYTVFLYEKENKVLFQDSHAGNCIWKCLIKECPSPVNPSLLQIISKVQASILKKETWVWYINHSFPHHHLIITPILKRLAHCKKSKQNAMICKSPKSICYSQWNKINITCCNQETVTFW